MVHPKRCARDLAQLLMALLVIVTFGKLLYQLTTTLTDWSVESSGLPFDAERLSPYQQLAELSKELNLEGRSCSSRKSASLKLEGDIVCTQNSTEETYLTLFSSMTYRKDKLTAYSNTLTLWPKLPKTRLVLFIAPLDDDESSDFSEDMNKMAAFACQVGWEVFIAPRCNKYNYPVLSSMFLLVEHLWTSTWVAYSNGDIIHTESLLQTLEGLEADTRVDPHFLVGRRRNIKVWLL